MILPDFYTSLKEGNKNWHFSFVRLIWLEISIFHGTLRLFLKPFPLFGLKMKEYQEKKETYKQKIKEGFKL